MLRKSSKCIYTAEAAVTGGRQGHARTSDGLLDMDVRLPIAPNPEQLFAVGYGACFQSALDHVGRRLGFDTSASTVTARVSIGPSEGENYGLL